MWLWILPEREQLPTNDPYGGGVSDVQNPLIPAGYDIVWSLVAVLVIALTIAALVTIARSARRLTATQALIWTVIVLLVPLLGPVAWLTIGRRAVPPEPTT